jgi:hypothetical protein
MNNVITALDTVMRERIYFSNKTVNSKIDRTIVQIQDAQAFLTSLNDFYLALRQTRIDKRQFIKENNYKLDKLKSTLVSAEKEYYKAFMHPDLAQSLTNVYNKIYINLSYNQKMAALQSDATRYFTNFVKGITYFKNEEQPLRDPVYHRNASCGSKNQQSYMRFTIERFGPDKSHLVYRCLLERLIYDKIYENTLRLQDLGHKHELGTVQRIYDEYFPVNSLRIIKIEYVGEMPRVLIIGHYFEDNLIGKEIYIRYVDANNDYQPQVDCEKEDNLTQTRYEKIQTYDGPTDWVEVL